MKRNLDFSPTALLAMCFLACLAGGGARPAFAQYGSGYKKPSVSKVPSSVVVSAAANLSRLPAPLRGVMGNIRDLEQTGHLVVTKAHLGPTDFGSDQALIWTLRVDRPVTCRHVVTMVQELRDVRFFRIKDRRLTTPQEAPASNYKGPTGKPRSQGPKLPAQYIHEIYTTLLHHDSRISSGAASGAILNRDEQFTVWIYLSPKQVRKIAAADASRVVFSAASR